MIEQGSPEWLQQRLGKATASRMADVFATTKSGPSAMRTNYIAELAVQRLTGRIEPSYTNAAMQWGTDTEPDAKLAYSFMRDVAVEPAGFVEHPRVAMSGASPDGYVGRDGLVEIKCPNSATHMETLLGKSVPGKYLYQIKWQLACTGRQWCDFVSFDPRFPEPLQLFVRRVARDDAAIAAMETDVAKFLGEVDAKVAALSDLMKEAA